MDPAAAPIDLYNTPAGVPPPGVTPNFDAKAPAAPAYYAIGGILVFSMMAFMLLRTYTKLFLQRKFQWQDLTITIGFLGAIFYFIVGVLFLELAGGNKHVWDVRLSVVSSAQFVQISWLSDAWPTLFFWMIRVSFFLLFLELFYPFKWVRIVSWASLIVMSGFYLPYFIVQMYWTSPKNGETWVESFSDPLFIKSVKLSVPLAAVGLFFDLFIFAVPLIAVNRLQMSKKTKFEVSLVFSTAFTAIVASVASLAYRIVAQHNPADFTYIGFPAIFCSVVEMCVGVIVFCMPSVAHMYNHHRSKRRPGVSNAATTSKKNLVGGSTQATSWGGSGNRTVLDNSAHKKSTTSSNDSRRDSFDKDLHGNSGIRRDVEYGVSIELSNIEGGENNHAHPWK